MNQENPTPYETTPASCVHRRSSLSFVQSYRPYVTYILIGICVVIYLIQMATQTLVGYGYSCSLGG